MTVEGSVLFWGFLVVLVVAVSWRKVAMKREAQATIRLALEKGQPLDPVVMEKLLRTGREPSPNFLRFVGTVLLAIGLALPVAGYLFEQSGEAGRFYEMAGWGVLFSFVGLAILLFRFVADRSGAASDSGHSPS